MHTDPTPAAHRCACGGGTGPCAGGPASRPGLNRRQFLAASAGGVLGALGAAAGTAAEKVPPVDIGPLKDYAEDGISDRFTKDDFFVIRHQGRLFAASVICPHMGNTLRRDPQDPTRILCSSHGSAFDAEGLVLVGPASSGLTRLGISVNAAGRVLVDPGKEFPQEKWSDPGCTLGVK